MNKQAPKPETKEKVDVVAEDTQVFDYIRTISKI